jgi:hypothetical protein
MPTPESSAAAANAGMTPGGTPTPGGTK